ncbi:hypothetical protein UFOVP253_17 [uncultured Caudovirales phage]|uniref:Uncharacterized protein n=1 Tax=uncultured Caudovirales phage TaxID=2100421 RepID=A0A6J5LL73_9CAUD|nr:hypothetical protein UFOVP253_17 [uncultured Caudovirales phage]
MSVSWLAEVIFFGAYFVAWLTREIPHTTWLTGTAIAALVIAILLVVDNRGVVYRRPPQV